MNDERKKSKIFEASETWLGIAEESGEFLHVVTAWLYGWVRKADVTDAKHLKVFYIDVRQRSSQLKILGRVTACLPEISVSTGKANVQGRTGGTSANVKWMDGNVPRQPLSPPETMKITHTPGRMPLIRQANTAAATSRKYTARDLLRSFNSAENISHIWLISAVTGKRFTWPNFKKNKSRCLGLLWNKMKRSLAAFWFLAMNYKAPPVSKW